MANPVWNRSERRLRALWRILIYIFAWRALLFVLDRLLIPAGPGLAARPGPIAAPALLRALHYAWYLLSVVGVTWLAARYVDRRRPHTLGLHLSKRWWWELAAGLLLGLLLISMVFGVEWALGWVTVTGVWAMDVPGKPFLVGLLGPLAIFVVIGFCEELMFRGYLLRNSAEGLRGALGAQAAVIAAWLITSLLFGLYHVFNPHATWFGTFNLFVAGLMLGLPMVLTGRLAMPIGLHITWNFAQANLFGFAVSGNNFSGGSLLRTEVTGPTVWTGGPFGPEAGWLGLIAIGLGIAVIGLWLQRRDGRVRIAASLALPPAAVHAMHARQPPASVQQNS